MASTVKRNPGAVAVAVGVAAVATALLPAAEVPLVRDDSYFALGIANRSHGFDLGHMVSDSISQGQFDPLGRLLSAVYYSLIYVVSSWLNVTPRYIAFALLVLCAVAAVVAATWVFQLAWRAWWPSRPLPASHAFALLSAVVATTVQFHPWSNDPVTSYPPWGWGTAAIGFVVIAMTFRGCTLDRFSLPLDLGVAVLGLAAVLYYPQLLFAVLGAGLMVAYKATRTTMDSGWRNATPWWLRLVVWTVVPSGAFAAGRLMAHAARTGSGYLGTEIGSISAAFKTMLYLAIGSLPGSSWPLQWSRVGPPPLNVAALVAALVIALLAAVACSLVARAKGEVLSTEPPAPNSLRWWLVAALLVTCLGGLLSHGLVVKQQREITSIGRIYLSYATAMLGVAIALTLLVGWALYTHRTKGVGSRMIAAALIVFIVAQVALNWQAASVLSEANRANWLVQEAATTDHLNQAGRCAAMRQWLAGKPDGSWYAGLLGSLNRDYPMFFGEPFCDDRQLFSWLEERGMSAR